MHRAFAAWLTARPWHAAFASALAGALFPSFVIPFVLLPGAISVLVMLRFDWAAAVGIALCGVAAAALVVLASSPPSLWVFVLLVSVGLLFVGPLAFAAVLKRTTSMTLAVQLAVLAAAAAVVLAHALTEDPGVLWEPAVEPVVASMVDAGLYSDSERHEIVQRLAQTMWGMLAACSMVLILGALFLGSWWQSLLSQPGAFGQAYRRLRLGVVLGTSLTIVFALFFWRRSSLVTSLASVGLVALMLQGLAAAHRSKARGSLNKGWLAAIYVLLVVPLWNSVTICALAAWGFVDNWRKPKPQNA